MDLIKVIAAELKITPRQIESTVKLLDDGNTIPFIARYRKEATGELDEEKLRDIEERLNYLRNLEARKGEVLKSIEEQGKLILRVRPVQQGRHVVNVRRSDAR